MFVAFAISKERENTFSWSGNCRKLLKHWYCCFGAVGTLRRPLVVVAATTTTTTTKVRGGGGDPIRDRSNLLPGGGVQKRHWPPHSNWVSRPHRHRLPGAARAVPPAVASRFRRRPGDRPPNHCRSESHPKPGVVRSWKRDGGAVSRRRNCCPMRAASLLTNNPRRCACVCACPTRLSR